MLFQDLGTRRVEADFGGGQISSDGGALLLRQVNLGLGVTRKVAGCFRDGRDARYVEHGLEELVAQRILGLALGYEDLNDHLTLRRDPLLAVACGQKDVTGERRAGDQKGAALAGAATLNRLEHGDEQAGEVAARYRRIEPVPEKIAAVVLELGARCLPREAEVLVLDFDATDDPLHGQQEGRFFHGYYGDYCYLPLFCFCGDVCLWAQLRTSDRDASDGTVEALEKIVPLLRARAPQARLVVRADSGFAREAILLWCEAHGVDYVIGLARNERLQTLAKEACTELEALTRTAGGDWRESARHFVEFDYQTLESWRCARRVIGKLEQTGDKENPRFVVTNLPLEGLRAKDGTCLLSGEPKALYETTYCARGDAENVLKQMKLDLFSGRTSTRDLTSNQLRLWWSALAYLLLERLRAWGLAGTDLARATLGTIRLRVLKIGALIQVSVRRVWVRLSSGCPWQRLFGGCWQALRTPPGLTTGE